MNQTVMYKVDLSVVTRDWCVYKVTEREDGARSFMFQSGPFDDYGKAEAEAAELNREQLNA